MSTVKEAVFSSYSDFKSSDLAPNLKKLVQYGLGHPLQLVACATFVCFALFPILAFVGFALSTLLVTLLAALIWESFLLVCAVIGLAIALFVALTMAGCCTGLATLVYFSFLLLKSPLKWFKEGRSLRSDSGKDKESFTIMKED